MLFLLILATPVVCEVKKGVVPMVEKIYSNPIMMVFPECWVSSDSKYVVFVDIGHACGV